jgi:hypothetical protein
LVGAVEATFISVNIVEVCEGTVHVVDGVIIPAFDPDHHPKPCTKEPNESVDLTIGDIPACTTKGMETLCALIKDSWSYLKGLLFDPNKQGADSLCSQELCIFTIANTLETLSSDEVEFVLKYHVVKEELFTSDLICSHKCNSFIQMLNGLFTETQCSKSGAIFQVEAGNDSSNLPCITETDIQASSRVVHFVNNFLIGIRARRTCGQGARGGVPLLFQLHCTLPIILVSQASCGR